LRPSQDRASGPALLGTPMLEVAPHSHQPFFLKLDYVLRTRHHAPAHPVSAFVSDKWGRLMLAPQNHVRVKCAVWSLRIPLVATIAHPLYFAEKGCTAYRCLWSKSAVLGWEMAGAQ